MNLKSPENNLQIARTLKQSSITGFSSRYDAAIFKTKQRPASIKVYWWMCVCLFYIQTLFRLTWQRWRSLQGNSDTLGSRSLPHLCVSGVPQQSCDWRSPETTCTHTHTHTHTEDMMLSLIWCKPHTHTYSPSHITAYCTSFILNKFVFLVHKHKKDEPRVKSVCCWTLFHHSHIPGLYYQKVRNHLIKYMFSLILMLIY